MDTIKAIVKSGRLELSVPSDWPDGTEVIVRPVMREDTFGIREEDCQTPTMRVPNGFGGMIPWNP